MKLENKKYLINELADYVYNLKYEDLSQEAILAAKKCILDGLGNIIYGCYSKVGEQIMEYTEDSFSQYNNVNGISIVGKGKKYAKELAIFAHTVMARSSDLDDGYRFAMGHPGSVQLPAVLGLAELYKINGKELITALVIGYELHARLGEALNPNMYRERGIDATGVCSSLGVAAINGKFMGLSSEQIANAMGITSLFTNGLIEYQNDGTSGKVLCSGWAALDGMKATSLAAHGYTGPKAALEGAKGYFQGLKGSKLDISNVTKNLGTDFKITEVYFKQHACMRGLHAALDAVSYIKEANKLSLEQVESIDVYASSFIKRLSNPTPDSIIGAQCSIEFSVATMLKHGHIYSEQILEESLNDKEVLEFAKKVKFIDDEEIEKYVVENPTHYTTVKIVVNCFNGQKYENMRTVPEGDVEIPYFYETLRNKFERMIEGTPYELKLNILCDYIVNIENLSSVDTLFKI